MTDPHTVPTVSVDDVPPDAYLLDVREPDEWRAGHAPGAIHIPLGALVDQAADLPTDRSIVVTCRVGGRSARAVAYLRQSGHEAVNLSGGMQAWEAAGRPLESESSDQPSVI